MFMLYSPSFSSSGFLLDLYDVGYSDNGYDHILVFADQFSRAVVAVPVVGTPTSKQVFDSYRYFVARYYGYARRIRTDRGSILQRQACPLDPPR